MKRYLHRRILPISAAAVAIFIAAIIVHFTTIVPGSRQTLWAAEQTDQALSRVHTLYMAGSANSSEFVDTGLPQSTGSLKFRMWACKSGHSDSSGDVRMELSEWSGARCKGWAIKRVRPLKQNACCFGWGSS